MDLHFLRELTETPGPYATVSLDASHDSEDAARTLALLRAEQVDTLLLDGGVTRDGELWVGENPSQVAAEEQRLRDLGSEPVGRLPVDAALLAAAAASGAAFQPLGGGRTGLVGKPVEDGVAALLRYPLVTHQGP